LLDIGFSSGSTYTRERFSYIVRLEAPAYASTGQQNGVGIIIINKPFKVKVDMLKDIIGAILL